MSAGLLRHTRWAIVAQAALVWAGDKADREGFIETGNLNEESEVIPFDQATREQVIAQWEQAGS